MNQEIQSPEITVDKPTKGKGLTIFLVILIVLLAGAALYLGYTLMQEKDKHQQAQKALQEQTKIVNDNAQSIRDAALQASYMPVLQQNGARECATRSAVIVNPTTSLEKRSDGSTKKTYAVGQLVCNNGNDVVSGTLVFVGVQSYDGKKWEFTYSGPQIPNYIYNTDPNLYNWKYNNPKHF